MNWQSCKNILCIRADNMGDVIMSTPAFRAIKNSFNCKLTLLTSAMGSLISPFIKDIDETIVSDLPWVKTNTAINNEQCFELMQTLRAFAFDAVIIFTVYSQSALPAALLTYMSGIPLRLAYARENPYNLLTNWIPDKEPFDFIQHQVKRDLSLVSSVGAVTKNEQLSITYNKLALHSAMEKLKLIGFNENRKWIVAHAGVSEAKRIYPIELWIETIDLIHQQTGVQILLTGSSKEVELAASLSAKFKNDVFNAAGLLSLDEFIAVVDNCAVVVSVNTSTLHIAAALQKPVIALYAQTNPQHIPWQTENVVLPFSVSNNLKSKNTIIQFVNDIFYNKTIDYPSPGIVAEHVQRFMVKKNKLVF